MGHLWKSFCRPLKVLCNRAAWFWRRSTRKRTSKLNYWAKNLKLTSIFFQANNSNAQTRSIRSTLQLHRSSFGSSCSRPGYFYYYNAMYASCVRQICVVNSVLPKSLTNRSAKPTTSDVSWSCPQTSHLQWRGKTRRRGRETKSTHAWNQRFGIEFQKAECNTGRIEFSRVFTTIGKEIETYSLVTSVLYHVFLIQ